MVNQQGEEDRDFSTLLVQDLAAMCKDLTPIRVLFYSTPFYPAVSSHNDSTIIDVMEYVKKYTSTNYSIDLTVSGFFTGLSDLSFVGPFLLKVS